jgi:16S rRNA processing protein RimM
VDDVRFLSMGKIVGAHGIKGVLKVFSYAESITSFKSGSSIIMVMDGLEKSFKIEWVKPHGKTILMALKGVSNRNQAEVLCGAELFIDRRSLEALAKGTWYWSDLIGLSVYTMEAVYVGRVTSIMRTGSNDVYVVTSDQGGKPVEILIPALEWVVREINVDEKRMRVDLPEGLQDL